MVSDTYYYENLDDSSRYYYDTIYAGCASRNDPIYVPGISGDQFRKVTQAVYLDHPELAYVSGIGGDTMTGNNINMAYIGGVDDVAFTEAVNAAVTKIMPTIAHYESDYERCKAIFDYLCCNVEYDHDLFDRYLRMMGTGPSPQEVHQFAVDNGHLFSAYSAFVHHRSVCNGIAKAFKMLCGMFSVPCICVTCFEKLDDGSPGAGHMLNMVTIGGRDAFVDATNCLRRENFPMQTYDYFLCSREEISEYFIIDEEFQADLIPENYFVKNRTRFKDSNALRRYLAGYDAVQKGRYIRLRFLGNDIPKDKVERFCRDVLARHAPVRKQWISRTMGTAFNAILCDPGEIRKINAANDKLRKGRK